MRLIFLALATVAALAASTNAHTAADPSPYRTYHGPAGGGTFELSFTDDLSGVTRVAFDAVAFQPDASGHCDATSTVVHFFNPPAPVGQSGDFSVFIIPAGTGTLVDQIVLSGTVAGSVATGQATYSILPPDPDAGCVSQNLSWEAGGPVDTPPHAGDDLLVGTVAGSTGSIEMTLDPETKDLTSMRLRSLAPNCSGAPAMNALTFFGPHRRVVSKLDAPPIPIVASDGTDNTNTIHGFVFTPASFTPEHIEGTAFYLQTSPLCQYNDLGWSVDLVAPPTPTGTASLAATPVVTPVVLPDTGGGPDRGSNDAPLLTICAFAAMASVAALALARRR